MTELAFLGFVFTGCIVGTLLGIFAHYWRAHATMFAEDLGLGEPLDTLTRDDYQFEKNVVGAEWDDAGFWAADSVRNLVYYMSSGFLVPLFLGLALWGQREAVVTALCTGLTGVGLAPPLCP
ncbi:MAG: hypothetical protein U1F47_07355 [Hyphomicrobiales bacterium]